MERFVAEGWNVVGTVRKKEDLGAHQDLSNVRTLQLDVNDEAADEAFAQQAVEQFGRVDALGCRVTAGSSTSPTSGLPVAWSYLFRAIDQHGQVIDVMPSTRRDLAAARAFSNRALTIGVWSK